MITYVRVRNLAIVEEVAIEPEPGLNVLTGETGAGKSLLIDSLQFLRGARGSAELVRTGAEKLTTEAVFQVQEELLNELRSGGIEPEDGELIIRREMSAEGRGRVLINGSVTSLRELSAALSRLLEIHGQEDSKDRIAGSSFREVLDLYAGNAELLGKTGKQFQEWRKAATELDELRKREKDRLLRVDLLKYQIDEIGKARLESGEEDSLRSERSILANARQISEATAAAFDLLSEAEDAALVQISRASQSLHPLTRSIVELQQLERELDEIRIRLSETVRELAHFAESAQHDPRRLEEIEDRLALLDRLKKKYGGSIEEVIAYQQHITLEFEQLQDYESSLSKLAKAQSTASAAYESLAEELSTRRRSAGQLLQRAIQQELSDLAMEQTRISITLSREDGGPSGFDRLDFLIAPNPGEELRPMTRIASGGELSRIQLAIAAALFKGLETSSESTTLVFDEIDAGIGGRVAEVVGRKLRELARNNQVICVTHLPQIASFATTHFRVWKEEAGGRTRARVEKLEDREERVQEIARMLGGEKISASALAHARELLESSARRKRTSATAV